MKILELEACPACGASEGHVFDVGNGNLLRKCSQCETVSALDYADPSEVYVDGYMFGETGKFGIGIDVREPGFHRYLLGVAHRRLEMIERATGLRAEALLDVGSGTGEVLMAARERGWRGTGVEPERTGAEVATERGLDVKVALLEESGLPERSFDVVSAFHVLEHMPDSRAFLSTLARWARPGGFVVVEVPNWASVQRRRFGPAWGHLRPHEHVVHFTPETLVRTCRACGIEPVVVRSPVYLSPPQDFDQALWDLGRPQGRFRHLLVRLTRSQVVDGRTVRHPTSVGWRALRLAEKLHDRAGVGSVVLCVGRIGGG